MPTTKYWFPPDYVYVVPKGIEMATWVLPAMIGVLLFVNMVIVGKWLVSQSTVSDSKPLEIRYVLAKVIFGFGFFAWINSVTVFYGLLFGLINLQSPCQWWLPVVLFVIGLVCYGVGSIFQYAHE